MNKKCLQSLILTLFCLTIILQAPAIAQKKEKKSKKNKTESSQSDNSKKDEIKSIEKATKSHDLIKGLFTFYQDSASGSLKMLIKREQLDKEYIHFYYFENGVVEASNFRGMYEGSKIFKIEKYFDRIDFILQNTNYYIDPESPIANSDGANISPGILFSTKIVGIDSLKTEYLIEVDDLFKTDSWGFIKFPDLSEKPNPRAFNLGSLSKEKTRYDQLNNYPENSDVIVEYVFENKEPKNFGSWAITDPRNISLKVQHSIIEVPESDYKPRFDDPRVGYFMTQVNDLTSYSSTPYRDLIHRWNLVKKDPNAELSEPVEPIVFWIENTTPLEIRETIKSAGEAWNIAFEKAGFKNAMQIKIQPDTATWDAGDIRYNVLRWTSSPRPVFGGYGPSFCNPRTGQILGADIMLEFNTLRGMLFIEGVFAKAGFPNFEAEEELFEFNENFCSAGKYAAFHQSFGNLANNVFEESDEEESKMLNEFLHFLILHEIGHTLGLNHNMKSSNLHSLDEIDNDSITSATGLMGSVMDYPAINFSYDRDHQGQYWTTRPGPYDLWAIEYGYKPVSDEKELEKILSRSTEPELFFGNDADDMRAPGKAIDPRVNVNDMTSDPIEYSIQRMELCDMVLDEIIPKYSIKDQSYQELRDAYFYVTGQYWVALTTISRFVGGVYVDRAFSGQEGATMPYIPVESEKQKKAMNAITKFAFAPNAFQSSGDIYHYLQTQRRGFNFFSSTEDPKVHERILNIQKNILDQLLHPVVLQRIVDTELYGNSYVLSQMMTDLNDAIFKADASGNVNTIRQNLQLDYTKRLIKIYDEQSNYCTQAKSMSLYNLKGIERTLALQTGDTQTRAHRQYLKTLIDNALEVD